MSTTSLTGRVSSLPVIQRPASTGMYASRHLRALPKDIPPPSADDDSDSDSSGSSVMYDGCAPAPPYV